MKPPVPQRGCPGHPRLPKGPPKMSTRPHRSFKMTTKMTPNNPQGRTRGPSKNQQVRLQYYLANNTIQEAKLQYYLVNNTIHNPHFGDFFLKSNSHAINNKIQRGLQKSMELAAEAHESHTHAGAGRKTCDHSCECAVHTEETCSLASRNEPCGAEFQKVVSCGLRSLHMLPARSPGG